MSVAVSYMPQTTTRLGIDVGPNDLLNALLASCQKPALNPPLPGFGRELEPFFAVAEQAFGKPLTKERKASPPKRAQKKPASAPSKAQPQGSIKNARPVTTSRSASPTGSPKQKASKKRADSPTGTRESSTAMALQDAAPFVQAVGTTSGGMLVTADGAVIGWAGPGFCTAPAADQLPMPSAFLLNHT